MRVAAARSFSASQRRSGCEGCKVRASGIAGTPTVARHQRPRRLARRVPADQRVARNVEVSAEPAVARRAGSAMPQMSKPWKCDRLEF